MPQGDVYIGLGSNLDGPAEQVRSAVRELGQLAQVRLCASSGLYRSPPMGGLDQPDYINAVVQVETDLEPEQLLHELQEIERQHGRKEQREHWASRTLDLDLLLWGQECFDSKALTLPHPGLHERASYWLRYRNWTRIWRCLGGARSPSYCGSASIPG